MPELPEVETVRRGLEPAMDGARFAKVEVRRGDLRWPLPKDFAKRLVGKTVTGMGRRAKYLLTDLVVRRRPGHASRHVGLVPCFSGRVRWRARPLSSRAHQARRPRPCGVSHVVGRDRDFNDPRRFGSMKIVARDRLDAEPLLRARPRAARQRVRRRHPWRAPAWARRPVSRRRCSISGSSPASAISMCARRCIAPNCRRNAHGLHHRVPDRRAERARRTPGRKPSGRCSTKPSRPAARRCAITG